MDVTSREFSIDVVRQLHAQGFTAYWAGGCVRDLLLGRTATDFDVATNATPEQVRRLFGARRTLAVGESFGVIVVLGPKPAGQVEVATFRADGEYYDGRRPSHVDYCDAREDALRRDFTINGMFYDPLTQTVHDFVGGQADLQRRMVRAIGNPRARMTEDKLRMLRAVRFSAVLDFELDSQTADAIREMAGQIIVVSAERIAQELHKLLPHANRSRGLRLLRAVDLLPIVLPEVQATVVHFSEERWELTLRVLEILQTHSFTMPLAALLRYVPAPDWHRKEPAQHGTVQDLCRRLRFSNDELEQVFWLVKQQSVLATAPQLSLAELKRLLVHPHFDTLLQLARSWATVQGDDMSPFGWIDAYRDRTPAEMINPPELLVGRDLIALGHTPGPDFRYWLDTVRNAQLNEQIQTRESALALLQQLQSTRPSNPDGAQPEGLD